MAAAVGKPDALRTEIVKAYGFGAMDLRQATRWRRRSATGSRCGCRCNEYPREVEVFVDALLLTTSGKVIRRMLRSGRWRRGSVG